MKKNRLSLSILGFTTTLVFSSSAMASGLDTAGGLLIPAAFAGNPGSYAAGVVSAPVSSGSYFALTTPFALSNAWNVSATITGSPFLAICTTANCSSFDPSGIGATSGSYSYTNANTGLVGTAYGLFFGSNSGTTSFSNVVFSFASTNVSNSTASVGNSSASGAARVIDANSNLLALITGQTTDKQVSDAASQTLPLLTGGTTTAVRSSMGSVNGIIQSRLDHVSGRASGDSFLGDKNVWLKPFASRADQNDRDGVAGFRADTYGLAIGVDGTLSPALRIGGAFAYASSDVNGKSATAPQSNDVNIYQLIGYGSYAIDDRTDINFQVDVGQNTNKGRRQIAFTSSTASSNYNSDTAHVGLSIGRAYPLSGSTTLIPSLRADYTWIKDKSYSESGAGLLNLNVASRSAEAFIVAIDGKLAHQLNDQTTLIANLGVGYDAINKRDAISASFAGASNAAFVTYGIDPSPWIGRAGAGAVYKLKSGLEITGRYDIEYRESFLNQTASANVRWSF